MKNACGVTTDDEKIGILNSMICMDADSFAGKILKTIRFKQAENEYK